MPTNEELHEEIERLQSEVIYLRSAVDQYDKEIGWIIGKLEDLERSHESLRIELEAHHADH